MNYRHFFSSRFLSYFLISFLIPIGCDSQSHIKKLSEEEKRAEVKEGWDTVQTTVGQLILPPPYHSESVRNSSRIVDWPEGKLPTVPEGFTVSRFAADLDHPRWIYIGPQGEYFVAESKEDRILRLIDENGDGTIDRKEIFMNGLNKPFGMLIIKDHFYVANQDGVLKIPYQGEKKLEAANGKKIIQLPAGGYNHHWTRNIITNKAQDKLYISVGSASNVGEYGMDEEIRRANILVTDLEGKNEKVYASGLRNPVGMDWNPVTGELWTAVNERDKLGDQLVPDYITSVKENGFYGWPYSYFGQIEDPRLNGRKPELVAKAIVPDVPTKAHTASLGLVFYDKRQFPEKYRNGTFIGQHGSWNRADLSGYQVAFVSFENGKPTAEPMEFMGGFIAKEKAAEVYGRPVCVALDTDGSLLVTDDAGDCIWKVTYGK
jgi:glucose/arabinose dehydrogenase